MNKLVKKCRLRQAVRGVTALLAIACAGCFLSPKPQPPIKPTMAQRDINAVLNDHDDALMAIQGVVGVYVGLRKNGRIPCLRIMVVRKNQELVRKLPKILEGYPVEIEETGVIRPLQDK